MCQGIKSWEWEREKIKKGVLNCNFRRQKFTAMGYLGTQMKMFDLLLARTGKIISGSGVWIRKSN